MAVGDSNRLLASSEYTKHFLSSSAGLDGVFRNQKAAKTVIVQNITSCRTSE